MRADGFGIPGRYGNPRIPEEPLARWARRWRSRPDRGQCEVGGPGQAINRSRWTCPPESSFGFPTGCGPARIILAHLRQIALPQTLSEEFNYAARTVFAHHLRERCIYSFRIS